MTRKFENDLWIGDGINFVPVLVISLNVLVLIRALYTWLQGSKDNGVWTFVGRGITSKLWLSLPLAHVVLLAWCIIYPAISDMGPYKDIKTIDDDTATDVVLNDSTLPNTVVTKIDAMFKAKIESFLNIKDVAVFKSETTVGELNKMITTKRWINATVGSTVVLLFAYVILSMFSWKSNTSKRVRTQPRQSQSKNKTETDTNPLETSF